MQHRDALGMPVWNTSKELVPVPKRYYDERINVSFHVTVPEWSVIDACRGKVNSASITFTVNGASRTFAAKTLLLDSDSFTLVYDQQGNKAINYRYLLLYRKDGWEYKVENKSYTHLDTGGKRVPWLDSNGQPEKEPVAMLSSGNRCDTGDAVYLITKTIYSDVSFTSLLTGL